MILRALGLGDFLTGVPAYRALRNAFPQHRIVVAAPDAVRPLAQMTGVIDEVLPSGPLEPLAGRVAAPEIAVNMHGRGPESTRILAALHPGRLISFVHPDVPESAGSPEWRADEHEIHRWCRLLRENAIGSDPDRLELEVPQPAPELAAATVVHPGAAAGARRWPVERWAEVARHEAGRGRRVLVTGGQDEVELAGELALLAGLSPTAVLAGKTDLAGLASVVAGASRVASADTGVAHLATATRTPSVVLFGPTSPRHWGPPPDRPWHVALWKGTLGDPLSDRPDPGLLAITAGEVISALDRLPERLPSSR